MRKFHQFRVLLFSIYKKDGYWKRRHEMPNKPRQKSDKYGFHEGKNLLAKANLVWEDVLYEVIGGGSLNRINEKLDSGNSFFLAKKGEIQPPLKYKDIGQLAVVMHIICGEEGMRCILDMYQPGYRTQTVPEKGNNTWSEEIWINEQKKKDPSFDSNDYYLSSTRKRLEQDIIFSLIDTLEGRFVVRHNLTPSENAVNYAAHFRHRFTHPLIKYIFVYENVSKGSFDGSSRPYSHYFHLGNPKHFGNIQPFLLRKYGQIRYYREIGLPLFVITNSDYNFTADDLKAIALSYCSDSAENHIVWLLWNFPSYKNDPNFLTRKIKIAIVHAFEHDSFTTIGFHGGKGLLITEHMKRYLSGIKKNKVIEFPSTVETRLRQQGENSLYNEMKDDFLEYLDVSDCVLINLVDLDRAQTSFIERYKSVFEIGTDFHLMYQRVISQNKRLKIFIAQNNSFRKAQ